MFKFKKMFKLENCSNFSSKLKNIQIKKMFIFEKKSNLKTIQIQKNVHILKSVNILEKIPRFKHTRLPRR
jgi:ribosomal protein S2